MLKDRYIIEQDLVGVKIKKLNISIAGCVRKSVKLTDEKLQDKIEEFKSKGLIVETYHQEKFGNEIVFIQDLKIKDYKELKEILNQCRNSVEKKSKEIIENGEIDSIRNRLYNFDTQLIVFSALLNYAKVCYKPIITITSLLYLVECIGNSYDTELVLEELRKQRIYVHFLDCNVCTGISDEVVEVDLEYLDILVNQFFLEDLLRKMYKENQLSYEKCREYGMSEEEYEIYDPNNDTFEEYV